MNELNMNEIESVNGGVFTANEGASFILALEPVIGPETFVFALPIEALPIEATLNVA